MARKYDSSMSIPAGGEEDMLLIQQVQDDDRLFRAVVTREVLAQKRRCLGQIECFEGRISSLETWRKIIAGGMVVAGILAPVIGWLLAEYVWK